MMFSRDVRYHEPQRLYRYHQPWPSMYVHSLRISDVFIYLVLIG